MVVIVDIDSTLNDLVQKTILLYNSRNGKNIQMSDIIAYDFYDCLSYEDATAMEELFKDKELWDSLEPLPDSQWGIETIRSLGHKVVFATCTHECNFGWKCSWMIERFNLVNSDDIIRIMDKSLLRGDVIIDDCLDNLIRSPCERICLDYPYNRDERLDYIYDIKRAYNWKDIINIIKNIERENEKWRV